MLGIPISYSMQKKPSRKAPTSREKYPHQPYLVFPLNRLFLKVKTFSLSSSCYRRDKAISPMHTNYLGYIAYKAIRLYCVGGERVISNCDTDTFFRALTFRGSIKKGSAIFSHFSVRHFLSSGYFVSEKKGVTVRPSRKFFSWGGISRANGRHFRVIIVAVAESAKVVNFHL